MNDTAITQFLQNIQYSTPGKVKKQILTNDNVVNHLNNLISTINPNADLITAASWVLNNITVLPICEVCGKPITRNIPTTNVYTGYAKWCSNICANRHPDTKRKNAAGVKASFQSKYGVDNPYQLKTVKTKIKQTCLKRYGTEHAAQSTIVKDKMKQTCLSKYGVDHYSHTNEYKTKMKATCLKRYGVEYIGQSAEFKDKMKQTCLSKYGVEYTGQSDIKKLNTTKTCLDRYGETSWLATAECRRAVRQHTANARFNNIQKTSKNVIPLFSIDDLQQQNQLKWHCTRCDTDFIADINMKWHNFTKTEYTHCPTCDKSLGQSKLEHDVFCWLSTVSDSIKTNDRTVIKPLELDIYIKDKNLAIEVDGLWWHSDRYIANNIHLKKTELCEAKDVHLIHIFENEWLYKPDIVKSRIKNLLGMYTETVGARKCEVKPVDSKTAFAFQRDNHLQGAVNSKVNLGLYHNNELISLMTFSKPRFSKKYEWELVRFCNKLGYNIPGAASKLLKHFEKEYNPVSLVSYADRRWSYSKTTVYDLLGMTLSHVTAPNYWYWKGTEFSSRVKYQKHKLSKVVPIFDINKSEIENMYANGYNRIFDCGNLVYFKDYQYTR